MSQEMRQPPMPPTLRRELLALLVLYLAAAILPILIGLLTAPPPGR